MNGYGGYMPFLTSLLPFIWKYKQYLLSGFLLIGCALVYLYIAHLRSTISDLEQENKILTENIAQFKAEIEAKYKTITGINHTLQECYKVQQMQQEDMSEIEAIMRMQDDTPVKPTKVTTNEISQKTYAAGINFINEQLSGIK